MNQNLAGIKTGLEGQEIVPFPKFENLTLSSLAHSSLAGGLAGAVVNPALVELGSRFKLNESLFSKEGSPKKPDFPPFNPASGFFNLLTLQTLFHQSEQGGQAGIVIAPVKPQPLNLTSQQATTTEKKEVLGIVVEREKVVTGNGGSSGKSGGPSDWVRWLIALLVLLATLWAFFLGGLEKIKEWLQGNLTGQPKAGEDHPSATPTPKADRYPNLPAGVPRTGITTVETLDDDSGDIIVNYTDGSQIVVHPNGNFETITAPTNPSRRGNKIASFFIKLLDALGKLSPSRWQSHYPPLREDETPQAVTRYGEEVGNDYLISVSGGGWHKISTKSRSQGIDGVYERTNPQTGKLEYLVAEFKYNTATYNDLVDGTQQLSQKWIEKNLEEAVGKDKAEKIAKAGYQRLGVNVQKDNTIKVEKFTPITSGATQGDPGQRGKALTEQVAQAKDAKGKETGQAWQTPKIAPVDRSSEFSEKVGDEVLNSVSGGNWSKISTKPRPQGIDAVYQRINSQTGKLEYAVIEFKYNTAGYNDLVDGTQQLSQKWIEKNLEEVVGKDEAEKILKTGYRRQTLITMQDGTVRLDEFTPIPSKNQN